MCSFNEKWDGRHPKCRKHAERLRLEFRIAVLTGEMDVKGYTENERKAHAKKATAA